MCGKIGNEEVFDNFTWSFHVLFQTWMFEFAENTELTLTLHGQKLKECVSDPQVLEFLYQEEFQRKVLNNLEQWFKYYKTMSWKAHGFMILEPLFKQNKTFKILVPLEICRMWWPVAPKAFSNCCHPWLWTLTPWALWQLRPTSNR